MPSAARGAKHREESLPLDTSCIKDQDCVPAPGCCPAPCTTQVINVEDLPRAQEMLKSCPKDEPCPSAGACMTHAYLCVAQQCTLVYQGDEAYHAR